MSEREDKAALVQSPRRMLEKLWGEVPLHRKAQLMNEGISLDPALAALEAADQRIKELEFWQAQALCGMFVTPYRLGDSKKESQ